MGAYCTQIDPNGSGGDRCGPASCASVLLSEGWQSDPWQLTLQLAAQSDPEGNGIEVYRDRPRAEWPLSESGVEMVTAPMDARGVLDAGAGLTGPFRAPAGTRMGHVHLRVSDLQRSRERYVEVVGLDVTQASYPGALFTSAGGYHHHLGMNTWGTAGRPAPAPGSLGLAWLELMVTDDGAPSTSA